MAVEKSKQTAATSGTQAPMQFAGRRWTVGTMVTVSIIFAAGLMILVQFMAFRAQRPLKWDLTSSGINSLNVGTRGVLDSLGERKVYLTSLYLETDIETDAQRKYRRAVDDLLRLYQAEKPSRIEIGWINPLKDQPKLRILLERVRSRELFETETEPYAAAIERFEKEIHEPFQLQLQGFIGRLNMIDQSAAIGGGAPPSGGIVNALESWLTLGRKVIEDLATIRTQPLPPYSAATVSIRTFYDTVGSKLDLVINTPPERLLRGDEINPAVLDVLASMKTDLKPWVEQFETEKQKIQDLPALELDKLERSLQQNNVIVVESEDGAKALSFEEVWPALREGTFVGPNEFDKHRFAGEGAITPTILQLIQKEKTALIFTRSGGQPLFGMSGFGMNAQRGSHVALKAELEKLNYLVKEWDVKKSKTRPTFDTPPTKTIYIVLRPGPSRGQQGMPLPGTVTPQERAVVLTAIGDSGLSIFMTGWAMMASKYEYEGFLSQKWGIEVDGGSMIITAIPTKPGEWGLSRGFDTVSSLKFREHALTEGLEPLADQCELPWSTKIGRSEKLPEEVRVVELAYVPASEDHWGVKDPMGFVNRFQDEGKTQQTADDIPGPFPMALTASKGEQKIVVLAAGEKMISDAIAVSNQMFYSAGGGLQVRRRAPGNLAFFLNILHYLDDTLQWINIGSPIDSSQIEITDRQLTFWRVLAVGVLPTLAMLSGCCVWYIRRR